MSAKEPNDILHHKTARSTIRKKTNTSTQTKSPFKLTKEQQELMAACVDNDLPTVIELLEKHQHKLDPDRIRDSKLRTPLLVASAKGNTDMVKELIKWGADVNNPVGDIVGNKPLHLAVISNNFDTVLTLLEAGNQKK
ncbi:ankyrin repeat-containing domain protein [Sporodiniella umbellata]|nr:ankyrin repeat-containing domain protein [Sporodiniella umbellata]